MTLKKSRTLSDALKSPKCPTALSVRKLVSLFKT